MPRHIASIQFSEPRRRRVNMAFPPSFVSYLDDLRNAFNRRPDAMKPVSRTDVVMLAVRKLKEAGDAN